MIAPEKLWELCPTLFEQLNLRPDDIYRTEGRLALNAGKYSICLESDSRDQSVHSSIYWTGPSGEELDETPTFVIFHFFDGLTYEYARTDEKVSDRYKLEMKNLSRVVERLNMLDDREWRDLRFFVKGFNEGYTSQFT